MNLNMFLCYGIAVLMSSAHLLASADIGAQRWFRYRSHWGTFCRDQACRIKRVTGCVGSRRVAIGGQLQTGFAMRVVF